MDSSARKIPIFSALKASKLKQNIMVKRRARKLYNEVLTKYEGCIHINVKTNYGQLSVQKLHEATSRDDVPSKYKFVPVDTFE